VRIPAGEAMLAVIVTGPGAFVVTLPVLSTLAIVGLLAFHVTVLVISLCEPSLYVAVAWNCAVSPTFIVPDGGPVTVMSASGLVFIR
jgi:hypothetical protein